MGVPGRWAAAVLAAVALLAGCAPQGGPPAAGAAGGVRDAVEAHRRTELGGAPLASWAYRVLAVRRDGRRATVDAELTYALDGYDPAPATTRRRLDLAERDGRWRVTGDRPAEGQPAQLWDQGPVRAARGARSLVLGVGQPPARLDEVAAAADRAVPAVAAAWPDGTWRGRVVVLLPGSLDAMAALLGEGPAAYRGVAAVTTGRTGGGAADRVVVNPEAYRDLGDFGRTFVLTHETAHVATRAATTAATPLWLSEGLADRIAYRGTGRTAVEGAPELGRAVRSGAVPAALPADADFSFGGEPAAVARAYEGAWLACELVAERWGEERLAGFYREAGRSGARRAFRDVLGTTPEEFTRAWQGRLRQEFSSAPSR
ncbi:hypothetical protein [Streptomyces roseolilacinus]|uniref:hypothetical protein n=1 Tax=Streptomyces roseolilacinus TaxID=66904 RepID=UPI001E5CB203|nr:hypothetical protein [Streptomyces roseolilacinus]